MPDDGAMDVALRMYKHTRALVDYIKLNAEHVPLGNWRWEKLKRFNLKSKPPPSMNLILCCQVNQSN